MLECWQQLLQAKEEAAGSEAIHLQCSIASRQRMDDFTELTLSLSRLPENFFFTESDLVLLGSNQLRLLAKVQAFDRRPNNLSVTLRCDLNGDRQHFGDALVPRSSWMITKLMR
jgi:hypothetical protein